MSSPQERVIMTESLYLYYNSEYGTVPSSYKIPMNNRNGIRSVSFDQGSLPTLTCESRKFLGWYLDASFTMPVSVHDTVDVTNIYDSSGDTNILNLYAKWQEMVCIVGEKRLIELADAIRTHTGDVNKLTLDEMIEAITDGLGGKLETCTVEVNGYFGEYTYIEVVDNKPILRNFNGNVSNQSRSFKNCLCNSLFSIGFSGSTTMVNVTDNVVKCGLDLYYITAGAGETATLTQRMGGGSN